MNKLMIVVVLMSSLTGACGGTYQAKVSGTINHQIKFEQATELVIHSLCKKYAGSKYNECVAMGLQEYLTKTDVNYGNK